MKFYMASDGNTGNLPIVLLDWKDVPVEHEETVDFYMYNEKFYELIEYLTENGIPHQVFGEVY